MERVTAHLSKLKNIRSSKDDDMIFLGKIVAPEKEEYAAILSSIEEEKTEVNSRFTDLCSRLDGVKSDCGTKTQLIKDLRNKNDKLKIISEELKYQHKKLKSEKNELSNRKSLLEDRVKRSSHHELNSEDAALFADRRLRANVFRNLLGVKFSFIGLNEVVEGYVTNKNYSKWFTYRLDKYSEKEIVKLLWKEIKKCAKIKEWPVPVVKTKKET